MVLKHKYRQVLSLETKGLRAFCSLAIIAANYPAWSGIDRVQPLISASRNRVQFRQGSGVSLPN